MSLQLPRPLTSSWVLRVVLLTFTIAAASSDAVAQEDVLGRWDPAAPANWVVPAIHAIHLPTGEVLYWGTDANSGAAVWDVDSQVPTVNKNPDSARLLFCGGHAGLFDGSVLIAGGLAENMQEGEDAEQGVKLTTIFLPDLSEWDNDITDMERARWYPTCTTLADDRILAIGGTDENRILVQNPEIFDPYDTGAGGSTGTWTELTNSEAIRHTGVYPYMFLDPNGNVFYAGAQGRGMQSLPATLDLSTNSWTEVDVGGEVYIVALRASAVMYYDDVNGVGTVLKSGGIVFAFPEQDVIATTISIDLAEAAPIWTSELPMGNARKNHNLVVTATGHILAVGGDNTTEQDAEIEDAVRETESFDPELPLDGWTPLAPHNEFEKRGYHSTVVLLPDATVLAVGDHDLAPDTGEIFSPPYLFEAGGGGDPADRPIIDLAPSIVMHGETFSVSLAAGPVAVDDIAEVNLVRLAAVTHGFDQNARFVSLDFVVDTGLDLLKVTAPSSPNVAPRGDYMLFLVSDQVLNNEFPSDASYVQLTCVGDVDGDGVVGIMDFLDLLAEWGSCQDCERCPWDLDGNCEVDVVDFLDLLASWGPCSVFGPDTLTVEEELDEACLTEADWDEYVDVMTDPNSSQADKDRYDCWMRHYIIDCSACTCVHPLGICPSPNPFL